MAAEPVSRVESGVVVPSHQERGVGLSANTNAPPVQLAVLATLIFRLCVTLSVGCATEQ